MLSNLLLKVSAPAFATRTSQHFSHENKRFRSENLTETGFIIIMCNETGSNKYINCSCVALLAACMRQHAGRLISCRPCTFLVSAWRAVFHDGKERWVLRKE
jgi:Uma2 family endonuclease